MTAITHFDLPAQRTAPATQRRSRSRYRRLGAAAAWWLASVTLFAGLWELAWLMGWAPELLLPPPHIFLQHFGSQARFFDTSTIGAEQTAPVVAVATTVLATVLRVLAGLTLGFVASLITGVLISQFLVVRGLVLPTITLLAPISPIAWLPVAIFLFGIGNPPAIFMVFIGVYFVMTLATIGLINEVPATYINVARTMGASRRQILFQVVLPAILPGLLQSLRLNLFAAWMVVLLAEAVGVGSGLGQVVMLARNTFNSSLVFFTMTVIGISGYLLDIAFRQLQNRLLWWQAAGGGALR
ncbi:ABC transporter permease [Mycolicibacterium rhodesiae]|uniref:ABC transporter permease n=1 Tax=Mycolicibacterium rhodesiae TaxID=36814 RepID=A0A1X0J3F6_MYCRH|nr:ABC transporter permease [Mycolicibacterium rhodesiae]MCV7344763.1 ABC transporter permease [Mycolicibacterium rhodesiae]ORB55775.1 ABC transporter permease [Mycolicibacterium rhodesiae]